MQRLARSLGATGPLALCCGVWSRAIPDRKRARAGKPKTITGFVTNSTPVLLGYGERAQLATDAYKATTPIVEGFVIVQKKKKKKKAGGTAS